METMNFISLKSPFGELSVFADANAIVALEWGRTDGGKASPLLDEAARQLAAYFDGRLQAFDLPLAPSGTAFQKAAWQLMEEIPIGHTRSYSDLARDLDSGARAVGTACGRNPIPVIIPCHRVIGVGGGLGGYTGGAGDSAGVATKRALLGLEGLEKILAA